MTGDTDRTATGPRPTRRHGMTRSMVDGMLAGSVGTAVLNAVSYGDMLLRARPASEVPAQTVGYTVGRAGLSLGDEPAAGHRREALGALGGYIVGAGLGAVYGLVRHRLHRVSPRGAGIVLAVVAMVGANTPAVRAGVTDPRTWGVAGWVADIVPHVAYGLATAATLERLRQRGGASRP